MCAIGDAILEHRYYPKNAYWLAFADRSGDNPRINPLITFANAMITFQNMFVLFHRSCQGSCSNQPLQCSHLALHLYRVCQANSSLLHLGRRRDHVPGQWPKNDGTQLELVGRSGSNRIHLQ